METGQQVNQKGREQLKIPDKSPNGKKPKTKNRPIEPPHFSPHNSAVVAQKREGAGSLKVLGVAEAQPGPRSRSQSPFQLLLFFLPLCEPLLDPLLEFSIWSDLVHGEGAPVERVSLVTTRGKNTRKQVKERQICGQEAVPPTFGDGHTGPPPPHQMDIKSRRKSSGRPSLPFIWPQLWKPNMVL